jgi:hypothetical protein
MTGTAARIASTAMQQLQLVGDVVIALESIADELAW